MGEFSYHNARLSSMGNRYVTRDEIMPLVETMDARSLSKSLSGDLAMPSEPEDYRSADRMLIGSLHSSMSGLMKDAPSVVAPLVRVLFLRFEIDELKRVLRSIGHRKEPLHPVGAIDGDLERQMLASQSVSRSLELIEGLRYGKVITASMRSGSIDLASMDSALEAYFLGSLYSLEGLPRYCRRGAKAAADIFCDRYNLHYIMRAKLSMRPKDEVMQNIFRTGGTLGVPVLEQLVESTTVKEGLSLMSGTAFEHYLKEVRGDDLSSLEAALDRRVLDGAVALSSVFNSNIGPTVRFMVSREMEVRNLRTLFMSKYSGWGVERTRSMLILEGGA